MDKNTITGFVLIALVLFGFTWYSQPSAEEQQQMIEQMRQDSIARAKTAQEQAAAQPKSLPSRPTTLLHYSLKIVEARERTSHSTMVNSALHSTPRAAASDMPHLLGISTSRSNQSRYCVKERMP